MARFFAPFSLLCGDPFSRGEGGFFIAFIGGKEKDGSGMRAEMLVAEAASGLLKRYLRVGLNIYDKLGYLPHSTSVSGSFLAR